MQTTYTIDGNTGRTIHARNMANTVKQTANIERRTRELKAAPISIPVSVGLLSLLAVIVNI